MPYAPDVPPIVSLVVKISVIVAVYEPTVCIVLVFVFVRVNELYKVARVGGCSVGPCVYQRLPTPGR